MGADVHSHPHRNTPNQVRSKAGFTLLEVLIALLILSIGLIGVAVLTVQSLQNTHSSLYTSIASTAALDYEERLWLDVARRSSGCPDPSNTFPNPFASHWATSGSNLGLPGLVLTISTPTPGPPVRSLVFNLTWDDGRFGSEPESFTYETRVLCRE